MLDFCTLPSSGLDEDGRGCSSSPPPPTCIESSGSEQSDLSDKETPCEVSSFQQHKLPKAGEASPSAVCDRRKLSDAIAASPESRHPVLGGRHAFVLQDDVLPQIPLGTPPKATRKGTPKVARSAPPKPIRSRGAPPRHPTGGMDRLPQHPKEGHTRAVAPLPEQNRSKLRRSHSAPTDSHFSHFRNEPSPLRLEAWSEPAAENFQVRGPNYLKDRKKFDSESSAFRLLVVDLVNTDKPILGGMCAYPGERVQQALKLERETGVRQLPKFIFAVNLCVPGPPYYHQVSYFGIDNMEEIESQSTPFGRLMNKFIYGQSDEFRNNTFKLIPRIVDGNYVVRKAVGSRPSILGKKIKQYYIRGERYFELIVDIASDAMAQRIVKLTLGYTKTLVVDMMFLLEGQDEETLPEKIFGGVRMKNIDFKAKDGKRTVK